MKATRPDLHDYTLPAYWASYLINGDSSGLEESEKAACDSFLERNGLSRTRFMDCTESFFSSRCDDEKALPGDRCMFTYRAS